MAEPLAFLHFLTDPWADPIMRRAFLEIALLGVAGGALGCWVVFYGLSYGAESLAHAMLPGLVVAALIGAPLVLGAAGGVGVAAAGVTAAGRVPELGRDTAVAVVVTALLGAGALLALSADTPPGLESLLFGNVLGLGDGDLAQAAGLAAVVLIGLRLLHRQLLAVGFDRLSARALGARPLLADAALLALLAATLLMAVPGLGNLLVVALLVGPAATARLLARRMAATFALAAGVGVVAGIGGLYLSYYAGTAAGASVVGLIVGAYLVVRFGTWLAATSVAALRYTAAPATPSSRLSHAEGRETGDPRRRSRK
jgi:ABC-type Mn2+/Zn2+ transport system permease subunit